MRFLKATLTVLLTSFVLIEALTLVIYHGPSRSFLATFVRESNRLQYSNLRVHLGRIKLPPLEKKDVLVLGDSQAFGHLVKTDDTFAALIGTALAGKVVNLGIPGTSPIIYNRMLEVGLQYDPELIIYCVYANDFQESSVHYLPLSSPDWDAAPDYREVDARLFFSGEPWDYRALGGVKQILNFSKSAQLAVTLAGHLLVSRMFRSAYAPEVNHAAFSTIIDFEGHPTVCHPIFWRTILDLTDPRIKKGFQNAILACRLAADVSRRHGKKFMVVLIPCKEMIYLAPSHQEPSLPDDDGGRLWAEEGGPRFSDPYGEFEKKLKDFGVPVYNATDFFLEEEKKDKTSQLFLHSDSHLSEAGHRVMADGIIRYLRQSGWAL